MEQVAERLFPNGVSVATAADDDEELEQAAERGARSARTRELLGKGKTLFQAHLEAQGLLAIADALEFS